MTKIFLASLFSLFIFCPIYAQQKSPLESMAFSERQDIAHEAIRDIYDGVLIVRLSSNAKKTAILEKQIADPFSSNEQRVLYKKMLKKSNEETRENNELLMDSFSDNYDFSEVFFVYDTSLHYLTEGHQKGIFLSQELKIDSTINLAKRPYRMARYGSPLASGMKEMLGIVVMNKNYEDLPSPFPYKAIGIRSAIINSEKRKERLLRHFDSIVKTLNKRFHIFYQKYRSEMSSSN